MEIFLCFQTVNLREAEVEETKSDPESDSGRVALEPESPPEPQIDLGLQDDTTDWQAPVSSTPEPVPAQVQVSTGASASAEVLIDSTVPHPSLDSIPVTTPDETENTPTSQNADQLPTR